MAPIRFCLPALALAFLALAGCRRREISSYRVPKEAEPPASAAQPATGPAGMPSGGDMAGTAVPTASGEGLAWTAPAHWTEKPASAMRRATFVVAGENGAEAELSVTAFPGDVGGELANLNRWRGQLGLPPVNDTGGIERAEYNGLAFGIVELAGPEGPDRRRLLGASVPFAGSTWFFKFTGPDALVSREKEAFRAFLASVHPPTTS